MLKGNDSRYLLKTSNYPDFIPVDLPPLQESIIIEYEKISKDNSYSSQKEDINESGRDLNNINRLKAIYLLMLMGDEKSIDELYELDIIIDEITPNTILRVKSLIELEQTNLDIYLLRHKEDNTESEEFNFLQILQRLNNLFQRTIPRDISINEFAYLMNDAEEIRKIRNSGRTTKF